MPLDLSDFMIEHRLIILIDIRNYSELSDEQQVQVIQAITNDSRKLIQDGGYDKENIFTSFIPTGDGFYIIGDQVNSLFWAQICNIFAVSLRNALLKSFKSYDFPCEGIRIAVHFGTTKTFKDIAGNKNYCGAGMNETARLLSPINKTEISEISKKFYGHENSVIISEVVFNKFENIEINDLRISKAFNVYAKHKKIFNCRFIDLPIETIYNVISSG